MTRKVHWYYLAVLRERLFERPPAPGVLGESVQQDDAPGSHGP